MYTLVKHFLDLCFTPQASAGQESIIPNLRQQKLPNTRSTKCVQIIHKLFTGLRAIIFHHSCLYLP